MTKKTKKIDGVRRKLSEVVSRARRSIQECDAPVPVPIIEKKENVNNDRRIHSARSTRPPGASVGYYKLGLLKFWTRFHVHLCQMSARPSSGPRFLDGGWQFDTAASNGESSGFSKDCQLCFHCFALSELLAKMHLRETRDAYAVSFMDKTSTNQSTAANYLQTQWNISNNPHAMAHFLNA